MLTLICLALLVMVLFKLLGLAFRLSWGIFKIAFYLVCCPAILLVLIFSGLFVVAIPLLLIGAVVGTVVKA